MKTRERTNALPYTALALALALGLSLLAVPAHALGAVDLDRNGSLTFALPEDMHADLEKGGTAAPDSETGRTGAAVTVALYKVADANANGTFTVVPELEGSEAAALIAPEPVTEAWQKDTDDYWRKATVALLDTVYDPAADLTVPETDDPAMTVVVPTVNEGAVPDLALAGKATLDRSNGYTDTVGELAPGLYLAVPQPAEGALYLYTFTPMLLSLPMADLAAAEGGAPGPDAAAGRLYAYTATLKPLRESCLGQLLIEKTLARYNAAGADATFVFQVVAELDGEPVYQNVFALRFSSAGTKRLLVPQLPLGATVTVTEVHSGASYKLTTGSASQTVVIPSLEDDPAANAEQWTAYVPGDDAPPEAKEGTTARVYFENDYDGSFSGSVSARNEYTYQPDPDDPLGGSWRPHRADGAADAPTEGGDA